MMAVYGMTLDEIKELSIAQFLLYSVEVVDIMKQLYGGGEDTGGGQPNFNSAF
jgi:hypothetical protein